jgi:type VI secretion system protein ImpK
MLALGTLAAACVIYLIFNFSLAAASDIPFTELAGLPPAEPQAVPRQTLVPPPPPPPPQVEAAAATPATPARPTLRQFLEPDVKAGLVQVLEDPQSITVRLLNRDMFASGSAALNPSYQPLLTRIGSALQTEKGDVTVNGYTDNQPIHTVQFPSNWQLSQARADVVAKAIVAHLSDPKRVRAAGKGDTSPVAANTTAEGRQQNRRTDVVLTKTASLP